MPLRVACMWKKRILHSLSLYLQALLDFFFPRYCLCCRRHMSPGEEVLCVRCQADLPRVRTVSFEENDIARIFWGLVPIEKGISFFHYTPHSPHSRILFELKYHNHPEVGKTMGRMMAEELKATSFFDGIDLIVPIPLSRKKKRQRGYNQSDWIAWGISEATGIPTDTTSVVRTKSNPSQTTLDHRQRRENVRDIFAVRHPGNLEGRHILLVDDVITTGATMLSCAETIARACRVRFSVLSLAWAGHS